jgi:hypothetical protein
MLRRQFGGTQPAVRRVTDLAKVDCIINFVKPLRIRPADSPVQIGHPLAHDLYRGLLQIRRLDPSAG